jgi:hypothetical protein
MRKNSKLFSLISLLILGLSHNICGQKTVDEFGTIIFNAFKHDSIDNICKLKPSSKQLQKFMDSLGINQSSLSISNLDQMNEELGIKLKKLCNKIRQDTLRYNLSWSNAVLDKVRYDERKAIIETSNAKGKVVTYTNAYIIFNSNGNYYILDIGDISKHDNLWKVGSGNFTLRMIKE